MKADSFCWCCRSLLCVLACECETAKSLPVQISSDGLLSERRGLCRVVFIFIAASSLVCDS